MNDISNTQLPDSFFDSEDSDNVCFLCENPRYKYLYKVTQYGSDFCFKRCQCGLIKQTPLPNVKFFDWFFNSNTFFSSKKAQTAGIWGYYDYFSDESSRFATSQKRYRMLRSIFERNHPLQIMKIGPATGTFLHVARQHGHEVIGCDVSTQFVEYAQEHYGVKIDTGRFERMNYPDRQFDVILLLNVIENVPNQVEFLTAIHRTLKPGGYFILNFVDMQNNLIAAFQKSKYFLYRPPVCYIYTMDVLRKILNKFGFSVIDWRRDIRYMHLEKISTLLGWRWMLKIAQSLQVQHVQFPVYAYPSRIIIAQKK
jgi:ubiquinone/menaquinone biosynthesis C-methylase UbiE